MASILAIMGNLDTTTDKGPNNHRDVEVFGSVFCPYTRQATRLLADKGVSYQYREVPMLLGWKLPLKNYLEMKRRAKGDKAVPQIFIDGEHYGDEERLFADDKDGTLDQVLGR